MNENTRLRFSLFSVLACMASFALVACGGTSLPTEFTQAPEDEAITSGASDQVTFAIKVSGAVGSEDGGSAGMAYAGKGSMGRPVTPPSMRLMQDLQPSTDGSISTLEKFQDPSDKLRDELKTINKNSSTGRDLVDMRNRSMSSANLDLFGVNADLNFYISGTDDLIQTIKIRDGEVSLTTVKSKAIAEGRDLDVEVLAFGEGNVTSTTYWLLPNDYMQSAGRMGMNIVHRTDGTLVIELFPDDFVPYGESDNGARLVIDTAVSEEEARTGNSGTTAVQKRTPSGRPIPRNSVSRFETPDGIVMWDIDGDGKFGSNSDKGKLFDTNGDGVIDKKDQDLSYAIDNDLNGQKNDNDRRLIGSNLPEDFISEVKMTSNAAGVVGNGLSTVRVNVDIYGSNLGSPIGSILTFNVRVPTGTKVNGNAKYSGRPVFVDNKTATMVVSVDPASNLVEFNSGYIRIALDILTPVLEEDGSIDLQLRYRTTTARDPILVRLTTEDGTGLLPLLRNTAPTLASVDIIGTRKFTTQGSLGLDSQAARIVEGNKIRIVGSNFSTDPTQIKLSFGGIPAIIDSVSLDGRTIWSTIPEFAQSGFITVIQGGLGASTSERLFIAGPPLTCDAVLPADQATGVLRDSPILLAFSDPIDAASLQDGIRIVTGSGAPVSGTLRLGSSGNIVVFTPGTELAANTLYRVEIKGLLTGTNKVRFDQDVSNFTLPIDEPSLTISRFTTGASSSSDVTPPAVTGSSTVVNQPATARGLWSIDLAFSEALDLASVNVSTNPQEADAVRVRRVSDNTLLPVSFQPNAAGDTARVVISQALQGLQTYTLEIAGTITDQVGNAMGAAYTHTFSTPLLIDSLSSISGPVGSAVVIYGTTFPTSAASASVTFNGDSGPINATIEAISAGDILVRVPTGAIDGPVTVTVGSDSAPAPRNFTVTTAGLTPRVLTIGAGAFGVAIDADARALVSYQSAGEIGLLDLRREVVLDLNPDTPEADNLLVGGVPTVALLDRTGQLGFTTDFGARETPGESIYVVSMSEQRITTTVRVGRRPTRMAVGPQNRYLYVTAFLDDRVDVVDLNDFTVVGSVTVGAGPNGVTISPDNRVGYVCNYLEGTVSVFDVSSLQVVETIQVGLSPARVRISPDASQIFVTNAGDNTIHVIDAASYTTQQILTGFKAPSALVFDPDGSRFFVTNRGANTVQLIQRGENSTWSVSSVRIATSDVPAGLGITPDGSLLVITNEGSGQVLAVNVGDPKPVLEGFAINRDGTVGQSIFSADERETIWLTGRGFGTSHTSVSATLGGKTVDVLSTEFSTNRMLIRVPDGATSGPVILRVTNSFGTQDSNDLPLQVTPKLPTVTFMSPGDGSSGIATNSNVVLEFNEPLDLTSIFAADGRVIRIQEARVIRVVRLKDDGSGDIDQVMDGQWTPDARNQRFVYTLRNNGTFFKPQSNNVYEVRVSPAVRDLFRNPVIGVASTFGTTSNPLSGAAVTSGSNASELGFRGRFSTTDTLGPRLKSAVYRDVDNNGVSENDTIELFTDEALYFNQTSFSMAASVSMTNGSFGSALTAGIGSSANSILCRIGAGAAFSLRGDTTLNFIPQSTTSVTDFSNNMIASGTAVPLTIDSASDNRTDPRLLAAAYTDVNSSSTVDASDTLTLMFNEPMLLGTSLGTPENMISVTSGSLSGASFVARNPGDDYKFVVIQLGATSDITVGTTQIELIGSGAVPKVAAETLIDLLGNTAYANELSTTTVVAGFSTTSSLSNASKPIWIDVFDTAEGVSEGDALIFTFTEPVVLNASAVSGGASPEALFQLGVSGDRFGIGARLAQPAFLQNRDGSTRAVSPNQIVVILGADPVLLLAGDFGQGTNSN